MVNNKEYKILKKNIKYKSCRSLPNFTMSFKKFCKNIGNSKAWKILTKFKRFKENITD